MATEYNMLGMVIVGYRYGKAPESGYSYNSRENRSECGVSMASVGYIPEKWSFAIGTKENRKKYYYVGTIAGEGGDDEWCLRDVKQIKASEYKKMLVETKEASNMIANYICDRKIKLKGDGFIIDESLEEIEAKRKSLIR